MLLQRSWTLQLLLLGSHCAPATPSRRCNCCFWGHATLLQRSRTLQLLLLGPRSAPATLLGAATAASGATQRSCNAAGRCNCYFWGSRSRATAAKTRNKLLRHGSLQLSHGPSLRSGPSQSLVRFLRVFCSQTLHLSQSCPCNCNAPVISPGRCNAPKLAPASKRFCGAPGPRSEPTIPFSPWQCVCTGNATSNATLRYLLQDHVAIRNATGETT